MYKSAILVVNRCWDYQCIDSLLNTCICKVEYCFQVALSEVLSSSLTLLWLKLKGLYSCKQTVVINSLNKPHYYSPLTIITLWVTSIFPVLIMQKLFPQQKFNIHWPQLFWGNSRMKTRPCHLSSVEQEES